MAEFNIDNIATELNNKIGKGECVRYPVSKWISSDGKSWCTVYNDGWKECGGVFDGATASAQNKQIVFPVQFDIIPIVTGCKYITSAYSSSSTTATNDTVANRAFQINRITYTGFYINYVSTAYHNQWKAEGY